MTIHGTVVYLDFEGGFYGIVDDDGTKYRPVEGLPDEVQQDGLRVEAHAEAVRGAGFAMWGRPIRLLDVRRL